MFAFDKTSGMVTMHRGDTGAFYVKNSRKSGEAFTDDDRLIYTVKLGETVKIQRYLGLTNEDENGKVLISFRNSDTDTFESGTYATEIRVIINPIWLDGEIVDGDIVRTVLQSTLTINDVLKEV